MRPILLCGARGHVRRRHHEAGRRRRLHPAIRTDADGHQLAGWRGPCSAPPSRLEHIWEAASALNHAGARSSGAAGLMILWPAVTSWAGAFSSGAVVGRVAALALVQPCSKVVHHYGRMSRNATDVWPALNTLLADGCSSAWQTWHAGVSDTTLRILYRATTRLLDRPPDAA